MFKVLVSDPISEDGIRALLDSDQVQVDQKTDLSPEALKETIPEYDGLIVRSQTKVTKEILECATKLKVIGRAGVGVDTIDLEAATEHGVIVVNAPNGNTISTCEHTFAMLMASARNIPQAHKTLTEGNWDRKTYKGVELKGKTLGIVGMGRIGSEVSKRAKAFQMNVIGYDPFLTEERASQIGIQKGDLDKIYENADFITVHTPLIKETHHLINKSAFQKMKKGVRIVNCARGGIIDETALLEAIDEGIVARAALDVFEEEPPTDNPLVGKPEVIVTPHLGASTSEAQLYVAEDVSQEILNILSDLPFQNAVNMPAVNDETRKILEPYYLLSEKLGEMMIQLAKQSPRHIKISYAGTLTDFNTELVTRTFVKGLLSHYLGEKVNIVNATHLAKQYGLSYSVENTTASLGYSGLISVTLTTDEGEYSAAGTLFDGLGPRIVHVNQYTIDIAPTDRLLYIQHTDVPGIIGHVGSLLGKHEINIATMQVGRKQVGGQAIMMLTIDKALSEEVLGELLQVDHIHSAKNIDL